mgnify:CR=1 FL=1
MLKATPKLATLSLTMNPPMAQQSLMQWLTHPMSLIPKKQAASLITHRPIKITIFTKAHRKLQNQLIHIAMKQGNIQLQWLPKESAIL